MIATGGHARLSAEPWRIDQVEASQSVHGSGWAKSRLRRESVPCGVGTPRYPVALGFLPLHRRGQERLTQKKSETQELDPSWVIPVGGGKRATTTADARSTGGPFRWSRTTEDPTA